MHVRCNWCNQKIDELRLDEHLAKHRGINYILKNQNLLNYSYDKLSLWNMPINNFNELYFNFLVDLDCILPDGEEKDRIDRIVLGNKMK